MLSPDKNDTSLPIDAQSKKLRAKIASCRRILRREYERDGMRGDDYGKRLWMFHLLYQLNEEDESRSCLDFYNENFSGDHGEVTQFVCWALILRRLEAE